MATHSIPTFQPLNTPAGVPAHRPRAVSRRPTTHPIDRLKALRKEQQVQEREKLVVDLLPLVKQVAFRIREHLPAHVEVDDLIADGSMGLLDAICKFDASKGVKLEIYARHRIRGAILDGLRGADPASRDLRRRKKRVQQLYRELEGKLGRPVNDEEMAGALGMNLPQWHRALNELESVGCDCSGRSVTAGPSSTQPSGEPALLTDNQAAAGASPFGLCYRRELRQILGRALSRLRQPEKQVITLYHYQELTMKQIADRLGVHESRVSQLHSAALARLRASADSLLNPPQGISILRHQLSCQEKESGGS